MPSVKDGPTDWHNGLLKQLSCLKITCPYNSAKEINNTWIAPIVPLSASVGEFLTSAAQFGF